MTDIPQLENGVGMLRLLDTKRFRRLLHMVEEEFEGEAEPERISIATGLLAAPYLEKTGRPDYETVSSGGDKDIPHPQ